MYGKRGREDADDNQDFSPAEKWRVAAELNFGIPSAIEAGHFGGCT